MKDKPIFAQKKSKKPLYVIILILLILASGLWYFFIREPDSGQSTVTTTTVVEDIAELDFDLDVEVVADGLSHPWDIAFLPDDSLIFTERQGLVSVMAQGQKKLIGNIENVETRGEGGLLGVAVDPKFEDNSYVYFCHNSNNRGRRDVRVTRYNLDISSLSLDESTEIVTGINATYQGLHSGCRIVFDSNEHLWITTGDAKEFRTPQDPKSLAGKILRVTRDGQGVEGNATGEFDPRIFSYGHRNVQGIVLFDKPIGNRFGFSAEHGPDIDDEINFLERGNFGWDPASGYRENVPMTDLEKFPNAISPFWSTGEETIAISGITLIDNSSWGVLDGSLVVASLKGEHLLFIDFNENLEFVSKTKKLTDQGRLRSVTQAKDGSLYVTTDNGENDKILKINLAK